MTYGKLIREGAAGLAPALVAAGQGGLRCIGKYLMQRGDSIPSITVRATARALSILNGAQQAVMKIILITQSSG